MKPFAGNVLDQTAIKSFVNEFKIEQGLMISDKGFCNEDFLDEVDQKKGLAYLIPLKQNSAFIKNYGMDDPVEHLKDYKDATILYKKVRMKNGRFLYSFRDPKMACQVEGRPRTIRHRPGVLPEVDDREHVLALQGHHRPRYRQRT